MKLDRYSKFILTVIAICLVWICIRDVRIGGNYLFANGTRNGQDEVYVTGGQLDVQVVGVDATALYLTEPITVTID